MCCLLRSMWGSLWVQTLLIAGIIGAGIGGTSAAYFLKERFPKSHIDIYENKAVGGRLATISIDGKDYEAGGTLIHPENFYMVYFAKLLDLEQMTPPDLGTFSIFNGEETLFQSSKYKALTMAKIIWRYGFDMYKLNSFVEDLLSKFVSIYDVQEKGLSFTTVEELVKAMHPSLLNYTKMSTREVLTETAELSRLIINELSMGAMRNNYGQDNNVQGFVGGVSLAGVQPGLWSIKGGNKQVPQGLLEKSGATLISAHVSIVRLVSEDENHPKYEIVYRTKSKGKSESREYDIVIMAAPLFEGWTKIQFEDFPNEFDEFYMKPHITVANFIHGMPNISYFGYENRDDFPTDILINNKDLFYNSIGHLLPTDQSKGVDVWKVFSNEVLSEDILTPLFPDRKDFRSVPWHAYPEFSSTIDPKSFVLHDRFYYLNAIESAASAMEMSAISAKNIALLAYNHWHGKFEFIDEMPTSINHDKMEL